LESKEIQKKLDEHKLLIHNHSMYFKLTMAFLAFLGISGGFLYNKYNNASDKLDGLEIRAGKIENQLTTKVDKIISDRINKHIASDSFADNNGCAIFGELQACWGKQSLVIPTDSTQSHVRSFSFNFQKPFDDPPVITNGINSTQPSRGEPFGVYRYKLTEKSYEGAVIHSTKGGTQTANVTMNYIAIGKVNE